jgi:hypothetical protein
MTLDQFDGWLRDAPLAMVGAALLASMAVAIIAGMALRRVSDRRAAGDTVEGDGLEGVIVSAVLGLLALLMGFTFSIVLNRFEGRRDLVLQEANAIGTAYLRAQLLDAPHRERISGLLVAYVDNRLALATTPRARNAPLLARNDLALTDLWAATTAATPAIGNAGVTGQFLASVNAVIDLDASRKVARTVRVPPAVFLTLFVFLFMASAMLGYLSVGRRGKVALSLMVVLLSLVLMLILDVDRPTSGGIREDQAPMLALRDALKAQPSEVFDRYGLEAASAGAKTPAR